jgi:hypothetical protein
MVRITSQKRVPAILIGSKIVLGFDREQIDDLLDHLDEV